MKLQFAANTDVGKRRTVNEDSFYAEGNLFAVADGLGGHQAGEVASSEALRILIKEFQENIKQGVEPRQAAKKAIEHANREVFNLSMRNERFLGMGTTITIAYFINDKVLIGHVGDSRAYLWVDHQLVQLTKDHTYVQYLIEIGDINESDVENHPLKSALTKAVGTSDKLQADIFERKLPAWGKLLLCTDGLTSMVKDEEITRVLSENDDVESAAERLVSIANERGGLDNITVVVISFEV